MTKNNKPSRMVLITAPVEEDWLQRLRNLWPDLQFVQLPARSKTVSDELWREAEILYMSFATSLPTTEQAPRLRWVQLYSAGADAVSQSPLFQTSAVNFTTTSGIHAIPMAEYTFTMVLAWFHRLPNLLDLQRQGQWPHNNVRSTSLVPKELSQQTIGIVGYGSIGRQVARLANAFGMRILAMQRGTDHRDKGYQIATVGDPEGTFPDRYFTPEQLPIMLAECDVVVIAVPLTPNTQGMFNEAAFAAMKPTAFLVNIARGEVCNESDLMHALQEKRIEGAALDVFQHEPLHSNSPLWQLPNVFITPHISGLTTQYNERAAALFAENLRRYLTNQPLFNVVDKAQGY
jgi:phosphoglycerate dehydrogenase-like enzyme